MANYVSFFRYSDQYEDVFHDFDNVYVHACAEYGNYTGFLLCREYRDLGNGCYLPCEHFEADTAYLETLTPAPAEIARDIIVIETRETISHNPDLDDDEKAAYIEFTRGRLEYETEA